MRVIELALSDIPADRPIRVEGGPSGVVVVRSEHGIRAFEDSCPHAQWRLSDGDVFGAVIECPGHGWEFNTATGRCVNVPAYCLKSFPIEVHGDRIRIDISGASSSDAQTESCPGQTSL
jgi:nitrite reductase/ring-hydroxylating ferredoxin subunit